MWHVVSVRRDKSQCQWGSWALLKSCRQKETGLGKLRFSWMLYVQLDSLKMWECLKGVNYFQLLRNQLCNLTSALIVWHEHSQVVNLKLQNIKLFLYFDNSVQGSLVVRHLMGHKVIVLNGMNYFKPVNVKPSGPLWGVIELHFTVSLCLLIQQLRLWWAMRAFSSQSSFTDLSTQSTEAFLVKWDAGQRPTKKGMSAN